jgi:hypothetical protein
MPHEKFDDLHTRAPSNALRLHRIGRVPCGALSAKAELASGLAYSREHLYNYYLRKILITYVRGNIYAARRQPKANASTTS